ncbi:hypothetical protein BLOT_010578 [Blomia tropicalis]|nr:hypothetical protein BLOT_010578 [Blomia tropicalis]
MKVTIKNQISSMFIKPNQFNFSQIPQVNMFLIINNRMNTRNVMNDKCNYNTLLSRGRSENELQFELSFILASKRA